MRQTFFWAMLHKEAQQEYSSTHRFAIVIALKPPKKLDGIMEHQRVRLVLFASYLLFDWNLTTPGNAAALIACCNLIGLWNAGLTG